MSDFVVSEHYANSADPDQSLCSMASDLDIYCLPITLFFFVGWGGGGH